jgi:hypothetical protein
MNERMMGLCEHGNEPLASSSAIVNLSMSFSRRVSYFVFEMKIYVTNKSKVEFIIRIVRVSLPWEVVHLKISVLTYQTQGTQLLPL